MRMNFLLESLVGISEAVGFNSAEKMIKKFHFDH